MAEQRSQSGSTVLVDIVGVDASGVDGSSHSLRCSEALVWCVALLRGVGALLYRVCACGCGAQWGEAMGGVAALCAAGKRQRGRRPAAVCVGVGGGVWALWGGVCGPHDILRHHTVCMCVSRLCCRL